VSDELPTATRISALEDQVYRLTAENVRLNNEVCAIGTRSSMDREEIESMGKQNDELREQLNAARQALNENDLELAKAMSRADVLAAEVRDARAWHDTDARSTGQMMELASNWDKSRAITDSTNALDPAKFEGVA